MRSVRLGVKILTYLLFWFFLSQEPIMNFFLLLKELSKQQPWLEVPRRGFPLLKKQVVPHKNAIVWSCLTEN